MFMSVGRISKALSKNSCDMQRGHFNHGGLSLEITKSQVDTVEIRRVRLQISNLASRLTNGMFDTRISAHRTVVYNDNTPRTRNRNAVRQ